MMSLLANHQQKAYTLFKMWPSLVIGSILRDIEFTPEFLLTITEDLSLDLRTSPFFLAEVEVITSPTHAIFRLDLAGLWKTMGRPIVDMDLSAASWMLKEMVMKRGL